MKGNLRAIFKKSPWRELSKLELSNNDDSLNEDGKVLFLSWLVEKHQKSFKEDVLDPLLEDLKKSR